MRTVHKFELFSNSQSTKIALPKNAKIVLVDIQQKSTIQIWIELESASHDIMVREFKIFGTGKPVTGIHVGSFVEDPYVWHVYEQGVT